MPSRARRKDEFESKVAGLSELLDDEPPKKPVHKRTSVDEDLDVDGAWQRS